MEPKKRNYTNIIIILLIVIIVVLGGVFFVRSLSKNTDDQNTNTTPTPTATLTPSTTATVTDTPTSTVSETPTPSLTTTVTPSTSVTPSVTGTATPTPFAGSVKVFYSKDPESLNNPGYVFYFKKNTSRSDPEVFTIERVIAGPTEAEVTNNKVFTPIKLTGDSNCGGKDFKLDISESKKATLQFCKSIESAGVGTDARIKSVLNASLRQFSTIESTVILTKDGNCFGDASGRNTCKS